MFVKAKPGFVLREIGETYIIVPVGAQAQKFNGIIKLNKTGKAMWEAICEGADVDELVKNMLDEYDISEDIARRDVQSFVDKAKGANLVELT